MDEDTLSKPFGDDWAHFTEYILFDDEGSIKFKHKLERYLRFLQGHLTLLIKEFNDGTLSPIVENLTLSGCNLFPKLGQTFSLQVDTGSSCRIAPSSSLLPPALNLKGRSTTIHVQPPPTRDSASNTSKVPSAALRPRLFITPGTSRGLQKLDCWV
ncbi:hypothetical protein BDQ12DRAFT_442268 [Crucibulum laeve]|uniref:HAM1-like N-terminal domain-containing protein n=1 Tax=Crucibulum laeve TaxID=68775 RepID=A0A5C3LLC3_9AGAR|nr:hypothetical protein BDQ12DRAFT_442268 [Crucibulum laeve]